MLYFLISFLSFILLSKSFFHKSIPPWEGEKRELKALLWKKFSRFVQSINLKSCVSVSFIQIPATKKKISGSKVEKVNENHENSLLDLPEFALEFIIERLSPIDLCVLSEVCRSMRDRCRSDHFWDKHMKQKWSSVIGDSAYKEWHLNKTSKSQKNFSKAGEKRRSNWNNFIDDWLFSQTDRRGNRIANAGLAMDSIKAWYLSLESGRIWFPAQVYNRENGVSGFMLSCYDARLCYDSDSDSFVARYSSHGRRRAEENIEWGRLRAPPIDTSSHKLHASDCLNDLKPGDHIEIQWRRNKEFPYGWWYCVVGHIETCDGDEKRCLCHNTDEVTLEFNQYAVGSRWRRTTISRRDHREKGNEEDGFYGGIRKLYKEEEIKTWKHLWPAQILSS